ncbi:MAG: hypothetical protein ONB44_06355 [candidate division KSB1 bacterium]|nr:hypothetical protein [candidate division KSB1 bacterium]MDZ7301745.1 hypothetical protein [candidate division KSB1 bacterium]MDZ7311476.1 hypothetical protein [candidate division KSB1 bacterium]
MKFVKSFLLFSLFIFDSNAFAQGGYAGAFLRMGIAPRSEAMGRAYVAVVEGTESAFYNPASAAMLERRELNTSFRPLTLDRSFAVIGIGLPIHPKADTTGRVLNGGLCFNWIHAGVNNIEARDFDGEKYATLSNSENAFSLSFALQPHQRATIGLSVLVVMNRLTGVTQDNGNLSASTTGFDLGALVEPLDGVRVGVTARNLNLKYSWNTQKVYERGTTNYDRFPRAVRAGVAISRPWPWLTAAADYERRISISREKRKFSDETWHVGAVANYRQMVQVRLGLNDGQPTFGAGYIFGLLGRKSELHYAFVTHPESLDGDHVFGWAFVF